MENCQARVLGAPCVVTFFCALFQRPAEPNEHRRNWERGFAVGGPVHSGYARIPAGRGLDDPNVRFPDYRRKRTASNVKILGPFVDLRVDVWTPVIVEASRLIANGAPPWSVANQLNAAGSPLPSKSGRDRWTRYSVIALVQHPIYLGVAEFARTRALRELRTGTTTVHRAHRDEIWQRERDDLRDVSDELSYRADDVIHARTQGRTREQKQVRRYRAPRDRRRALSTIFVCGVCDSPRHTA